MSEQDLKARIAELEKALRRAEQVTQERAIQLENAQTRLTAIQEDLRELFEKHSS